LVPVVHFRWPDKRNMPHSDIDATNDILVISNKVQGHSWFFRWTFYLIFILSPHFLYFSPTTISSHTHPQSPSSSPPSICSDLFSLSCRCRRHPLLPHAVREPFKLQVITTVRTRSELKLEFLWVIFLGKGELCPCTLLEINVLGGIYVACSVCPVSENRRQGSILLTVEKCRDFKIIY